MTVFKFEGADDHQPSPEDKERINKINELLSQVPGKTTGFLVPTVADRDTGENIIIALQDTTCMHTLEP